MINRQEKWVDTMDQISRNRPKPAATTPSSRAVGVPASLNELLADIFALYIKTKNFHWHVSGPHFRDYHLMFDDQATQLLATADLVAERVRKLGAPTIRSVGEIARLQRLEDADGNIPTAQEMVAALYADNTAIADSLRHVHALCGDADDVATASLVEVWLDEADQRRWFLSQARQGN